MNELHLQDRFIVPWFKDQLGYRGAKANTIDNYLIIEQDLETFIADTAPNEGD